MASGIVIKNKGVPVGEVGESYDPLILNFVHGAFVDKSSKEIKLGVMLVPSEPPNGSKKITNMYVNSDGKLVVEYEE